MCGALFARTPSLPRHRWPITTPTRAAWSHGTAPAIANSLLAFYSNCKLLLNNLYPYHSAFSPHRKSASAQPHRRRHPSQSIAMLSRRRWGRRRSVLMELYQKTPEGEAGYACGIEQSIVFVTLNQQHPRPERARRPTARLLRQWRRHRQR
jgi:hypothetical protein